MSAYNETITIAFNPLIVNVDDATAVAGHLEDALRAQGSGGSVVVSATPAGYQRGYVFDLSGVITYPQFGNTGSNHTIHLNAHIETPDAVADMGLQQLLAERSNQLVLAYRNAVRSIANDTANMTTIDGAAMHAHIDTIMNAFPNTN